MNSPTGQTHRRIFTLDGSNDADSRKDVPFVGSLILLPILGVKSPKKPIFRAWIGVFKPNGQNIESFMLSKLLRRFETHFAHDRDHQVVIVGGPNRRPNKSKMADSCYYENRYIII